MYATVAILAALQERQRSGLGQHLDIALLDSHVALLANQNSNYFTAASRPGARATHQNVVPYQVFAARDGHLIVATGNESQYRAYCAAIGAPELGDDPRFATNRLRIRNRDELVGLLSAIMLQAGATTGSTSWKRGRALRPINDIAQAFAHPQGWLGSCAATCRIRRAASRRSPPARCASPTRRWPAPRAALLGQHTEEVLARCWASPWMRSRPSSRRWPRADQATLRSEDAASHDGRLARDSRFARDAIHE